MISINSNTRQFIIPGSDLTFGVEADNGSERKDFQCPRYVGNNLDVAACFVRINYRNSNGDMDSYLVDDVTVDGDNVTFSWLLSSKVTAYKGQVKFVMCVVGPDLKLKWHTTQGIGQVYEGLEPDNSYVEDETADVVAQLVAMVEAQTAAVEKVGAEQIAEVKAAAKTAEAASVAEIEAKGVNTRESIPADYAALSEAVGGLTKGRAGVIVCEAEGSAVVVNDASDLPMQGLRIFGRSTQDGAPTPEAPVEIKSVEKPVVTVAGKNLLNVKNGGTKIGVTETVNSGRVTFSGTAEGSGGRTAWKRSDVVTLPPGTYRMSMTVPKGTAPQPCLTINGTTTVLASDANSFTVTEPTSAYLGFNYDAGVSYDAENVAVQLEVGKIATDYEPYTGQTLTTTHTLPGIPVTSGGNYTDGDGQQWICDEVDLERGVYVQRVGNITLTGNETHGVLAETGGEMFIQLQNNAIFTNNMVTCICNYYPTVARQETFNNGGVSGFVGATVSSTHVRITDNVRFFGNADALVGWIAEKYAEGKPVIFEYILETPIETPLSETEIVAYRALHTNKPNTTILNDSGAHMAVAYAADTKLYIDNKIKEALQ